MLPSNDKPILMIPKLSGEGNEDEVRKKYFFITFKSNLVSFNKICLS